MTQKTQKRSSTTIGCAWYKVAESGQEYYPISINEELKPLTITEKHSLCLFPVAEEDRKCEDSPNFRLVMSLFEQKEKSKESYSHSEGGTTEESKTDTSPSA